MALLNLAVRGHPMVYLQVPLGAAIAMSHTNASSLVSVDIPVQLAQCAKFDVQSGTRKFDRSSLIDSSW